MTDNNDSSLGGVSIRAWLAVILTLTVCLMSGLGIAVTEPLYSALLLTLGFFFGQKNERAQP